MLSDIKVTTLETNKMCIERNSKKEPHGNFQIKKYNI